MQRIRSLAAAALVMPLLAGSVGWYVLRGPEGVASAEAAAPTAVGNPAASPAPNPAPNPAATAAAPPADIRALGSGPDYQRCLAMVRDDPEAARGFAQVWEAQGGGDGARHCAALALLAAGDPARAAERLEAIGLRGVGGPAARAAVLGQAVQAWTLAGDAGRAFAAATHGLTLVPGDPDLLLDRAIALAGQGRHAEALGDLDTAVAVAPDRAEAWVLRATALRRTDRVGAAEQAVGRALALEPDNAEALLERGILRLERGDRAGANADWRRAIDLAPDSAAADLAHQNLALNEAGPARR